MPESTPSRNRAALFALVILLCALAAWHASRMDWLPYQSINSLIAILQKSDTRGSESAYLEISRRLRSGKVAPPEIEALANAAIQSFPFDSPPGTPDWQLRILGQLLSQDALAPQHARSFFEKIFSRDFRLGLSSEGIPFANQSSVAVITPSIVAESITFEFDPVSEHLECLSKRTRIGQVGAVFYGMGLVRYGDDVSSGPETIDLDARLSVRAAGGRDVWFGTASFVKIPWPARGQARSEVQFFPSRRIATSEKGGPPGK